MAVLDHLLDAIQIEPVEMLALPALGRAEMNGKEREQFGSVAGRGIGRSELFKFVAIDFKSGLVAKLINHDLLDRTVVIDSASRDFIKPLADGWAIVQKQADFASMVTSAALKANEESRARSAM